MKIGVILYHKNIFSYIEHKWIFECLQSIENQSFKEYDIIELNYSNKDNEHVSLLDIGLFKDKKTIHYKHECRNHIEAMNYILNKSFNELKYDVIFNVNLDDIYHPLRFELQLLEILNGNDLVSSNYLIFQEYKTEIVKREIIVIKKDMDETEKDTTIKMKIIENKNYIPTSVLCFTKKTWNIIKEIPYLPGVEGLLICKKLLKNKLKITICDEILVNYRIHDNQVSSKIRNNII